jgi:hypothetical protein
VTGESGAKPVEVAELDGAVAELVRDDAVAGWVAVQAAPFRNLFLAKEVGCWLLFTWADGSIEVEEDYPPFLLLTEMLAGKFHDDIQKLQYEVRWVTDDRRAVLWERYGMHQAPGHYMAVAARQRRDRR